MGTAINNPPMTLINGTLYYFSSTYGSNDYNTDVYGGAAKTSTNSTTTAPSSSTTSPANPSSAPASSSTSGSTNATTSPGAANTITGSQRQSPNILALVGFGVIGIICLTLLVVLTLRIFKRRHVVHNDNNNLAA